MPTSRSRHRAALLGLAVGDAVGTTVEFSPRGSFTPVTDMTRGGPFKLLPGQWTDDTSMALCLGRSLLDCGGTDSSDQMDRYLRWRNTGYLSSNGRLFDIGTTVGAALRRYEQTADPLAGSTRDDSAGMRLAPVALFYADNREAAIEHAAMSSRTTHGGAEAIDACRLFAAILLRALAGQSKESVLAAERPEHFAPALAPKIAAIAAGTWRAKREADIRGSGYVVDALEAALWCFANTESFADAILRAANLGDDADTTAAITGQLASAFYGEQGVPSAWRQKLTRGEQIARLGEALGRARAAPPVPLARTYWANPRALLAGAYPGDPDPDEASRRCSPFSELGSGASRA